MGYYAAVDLHGDNGYYGVADETGKRVFEKRIANDLPMVLKHLEPYRKQLTNGVVVESTFNWYWLVDGLMDNGYQVHLANPAAIEQYEGIKNTNDETDTFFLIELKRLGVLPTGYIYPQEIRPVRDLLRRRMILVQQRTAHILSYQSLVARQSGQAISANKVGKLRVEDLAEIYEDPNLRLMGETSIDVIRFLTGKIRVLEKKIEEQSRLTPAYEKLLTVPGIGKILALTIMLETGPIGRFADVGRYTSYCRCVRARGWSNGKAKSTHNRKNGNRYLSWAYVEAANFIRRYCPEAKSWYQRKAAKTNVVVATKALSSKLAKACYFIMRDQVDFDVKKIFG